MKQLMMIVTLAAAVAVPVLAQGPQRGGGRMGPGMGPGGPGGPLMGMLRDLNLSDSQREQIKAILDENRPAEPPQGPPLEQKLHAAILNGDKASIDTLKAQINEEHARELDKQIAVLLKIAPILTDDQKKQLLEPRGRGRH